MSSYEISKSSLLSLKAEILRKQQELIKAKADNDQKIKIIKKNTPLEIKNKGVESRQIRDLEGKTKSKLYEKLSSGKLSKEDRELQSRFLVRFDKKNRSTTSDLPPSDSDDEPDRYVESDNESYNSDDDATRDPGEKWYSFNQSNTFCTKMVDYTDCLGRTRKCLQKDLPYIMSKDEELKKTVEAKNKEQSLTETDVKENEPQLIEDDKKSKESELLSGDMRRELLRQQWEEEEETLRQKTDVHYQDILFGEARTHGVGYYGFSKDEEERAKQQEALRKLRLETEEKQKKAQELKSFERKAIGS
ncbi:hypothetical protein NQ317_000541 [Molorchus minor]|uniref:CCDC174 alpha/beta GRSR domain-containing protein n=1 Tax=Molorchus minor TaxID=1323400 RepID=A0ABQ9IZD7_9CUCU|nr:hypothetical protein NQ317_000541 [Molorchus minor]